MKGLTRLDECIVRRLAQSRDGLTHKEVLGVAIGLLAHNDSPFRIEDAMASSLASLKRMGLVVETDDNVSLTSDGVRAATELGAGDFGSFFSDSDSFHPRDKATDDRRTAAEKAAAATTEARKLPLFSLPGFFASLRRFWRSL